jgi:hypothetical protein
MGKTIEVNEHGFNLMRKRFAKAISEQFESQELQEYWYGYSLVHFTSIMEPDFDTEMKLYRIAKSMDEVYKNAINAERSKQEL